MIRLKTFHCLFACIIFSTLRIAQAAQPGAEEQAVRKSAQAFTDAYNKGDAKAVAALWATDGDYSVGRDSIKGRKAIEKLYEEFFKAHPGSKMEVVVESVRVFAPNVAIEQGTASVRDSPNGSPTASAYSAVHVKQNDGQWQMASVRESEQPALLKQDLTELSWLIGNWTADGDAAKVHVTYEWIANKNFIRSETKLPAAEGAEQTIGGTQIIGRHPRTGQIVSWFFNADGGHGYGHWSKDGNRWLVEAQSISADGVPSAAANIYYQSHENVMSWQSINRVLADQPIPDTKEIVFERVSADTAP